MEERKEYENNFILVNEGASEPPKQEESWNTKTFGQTGEPSGGPSHTGMDGNRNAKTGMDMEYRRPDADSPKGYGYNYGYGPSGSGYADPGAAQSAGGGAGAAGSASSAHAAGNGPAAAYNNTYGGGPVYGAPGQGAGGYRQSPPYGQQEPRLQFTYGSGGGGGEYKKGKQGMGAGKKIAICALGVVVAFGAGFGGAIAAISVTGGSTGITGSNQNVTITPADTVSTGEAVAAKVLPSVVGISTTKEVRSQTWMGTYVQEMPDGVGTGVIVDEKGYILTNSHVVSDGQAKNITVSLADGREVEGSVLWNDSTLDLAIVKIEAGGLEAAELGDSDTVRIGAYAAAIGNPLGLTFDRTVTQGGISGLNRTITVANNNGTTTTMEGLIQTDAAINSGNSGGPLLNSEGQVIGINTARASAGEGMGFAIPINVAKTIVEEVRETGTYKKAYIGISGTDVETASVYYQFSPKEELGTETGAYIVQIYTNSPAAQVGIREGDVIIGLDDKEITSMSELTKELYNYKPGDQVRLTIMRDKKEIKLDVTLTEKDNISE